MKGFPSTHLVHMIGTKDRISSINLLRRSRRIFSALFRNSREELEKYFKINVFFVVYSTSTKIRHFGYEVSEKIKCKTFTVLFTMPAQMPGILV